MKTATILNKTWKVKDLILIASTEEVKNLISELKKDPNYRPYDWTLDYDWIIAKEEISDLEKASFIYALRLFS